MGARLPTVAVWKSTWLPPSQTFVRDQLAAMSRWRAVRVGVRALPDGLDVHPDRAPFHPGLLGRVVRRTSEATGYRGVYDRFLREEGVRLVHAHFGTSAVSVLPVARRLGLPLVVTFHGYDVTAEPFGPHGARYRARLAEVFAYADRLLAVSDHLAGRLIELGAPESKVQVHHVGIPVGSQVPIRSERRGIVFVGRLVEVKGVDDLLAAVDRLGPAHAGVRVRIVGDGPRMPALRSAAKSTEAAVELLGRLPSYEVAHELSRAAVFCAPSRTSATGQEEAFGIVYLEAALHGVPVVAYRHGGVPEAVADGVTGLLAPEGDIDALAANVRALLDDPERAMSMGRAGRERVLREFDVRERTAELESIYDEVVRRYSE